MGVRAEGVRWVDVRAWGVRSLWLRVKGKIKIIRTPTRRSVVSRCWCCCPHRSYRRGCPQPAFPSCNLAVRLPCFWVVFGLRELPSPPLLSYVRLFLVAFCGVLLLIVVVPGDGHVQLLPPPLDGDRTRQAPHAQRRVLLLQRCHHGERESPSIRDRSVGRHHNLEV